MKPERIKELDEDLSRLDDALAGFAEEQVDGTSLDVSSLAERIQAEIDLEGEVEVVEIGTIRGWRPSRR